MSDTFYIKTGDTSPVLRYDITPARSLEGATVVLNLRREDGTMAVDRGAMTIVAPAATSNAVQYAWQAGDTDTAGLHDGEVEITYSDGSIETVPNYEFFKVRISDDLD